MYLCAHLLSIYVIVGCILGLDIGLNFTSLYLAQIFWINPWDLLINMSSLVLRIIRHIQWFIGLLDITLWFWSFSHSWRRFVLKSYLYLNLFITSKLLGKSSSTYKRKIESFGKGKLTSMKLKLASFCCWRSSSSSIRELKLLFTAILSSSCHSLLLRLVEFAVIFVHIVLLPP